MLTFARTDQEFSKTLNRRVNDYFKVNHISRFANGEMIFKTIFMFCLYLIPYALIISGFCVTTWSLILCVVVMSLGLAGIGLSIMHDANHGAYSRRLWINTLLGYSLNFVGANVFNWKVQHNLFHHTYTNVHHADEDINSRGILRLTPEERWRGIHRYQHFYAWIFYGLMTIAWMVFKDFARIGIYNKAGLTKKIKTTIGKEWVILIVTKLFYVGYIFVVPYYATALSGLQILAGILIMHYIAGFILAIIFQPAHIIEGTEFPTVDEEQKLNQSWEVHQLRTTTNFGNGSRWFSWFVGGLNFQIEHHLFPSICHVHYRKIANIVRATAQEFNLPYKSSATFLGALLMHARLLKSLGKKPLGVIKLTYEIT